MVEAFARTFESLQVRNYRWFFTGQVISWTGTWVQWVAQGWLVLQITHSGFGLGLVTALQWAPILLFGAWMGVIADRFDKRKILIFTNLSAAVFSLVLGIVTVAGIVNLWWVVVVALLLGVVTALDNPTRQTFTLEMVGRSKLTNAVSLNTATFTTARVLGPAAAGFLINGVGMGPCFLVNAVSFVPVLLALTFMNKNELRPAALAEQRRGQVREGVRYAMSKPVIKTLLIIMAIVGTIEYNFQVILPVLAKETFAGDATTLGILGAVLGVGMFVGSMTNAAFGRPARKLLLLAGTSLGIFTLLVAVSPPLWLAALMLVPLGASSMAFLATMNSTLQLTSSDEMRGRVMAIYFVLFLGSTPIGAPIVGWLSEAFSARVALGVGGVATLLAMAYGALKLPQLQLHRGASETVRETALQEAG
ncbi:MAG TPA: MFS transporter [Actinomycetota bacterium]|nr:MFS transporter [Actinomycetota bacterium]